MKAILFAVLLTVAIAVVHSEVTCYDCAYYKNGDNEEDKECKKPEDDSNLFRTCHPDFTQCEKITGKNGDVEVVARHCSDVPASQGNKCEDFDLKKLGLPGLTGRGTRCLCGEYKCNGASTLFGTFAILPALVGTAFAFV